MSYIPPQNADLKRILVTGATGFIGRVLVPHLVKLPDTAVSILVREVYSHTDLKPLPTELQALREQLHIVYADLRNFQLTLRAIREADPTHVIHLAAAGATDPFLGLDTAIRHNLNGTLNLIRACFEKSFTTQQLIMARTPGELSSMNVYAASKLSAWNFCEMYGRTQQWPIHGAMIFQAYGPTQTARNIIPAAIHAALANEDFPMTSGKQEKDWLYESDVAQGFIAMLGKDLAPGATIELGSGIATSVAKIITQIYDLVGCSARPLIGRLPDRPGEAQVQIADVARTKELIGWETAVSLTEGLKSTIKEIHTSLQ